MKPDKLEQLLHENECTYLDFKQTQYPLENDVVKSELLKDIIAIANAETGREGFILIGAEEVRGGRAKIHGVTSHLNDHDLQQLVNSKIQRPLRFSYEVVPCDGVALGVISVPAQDGYFFLKNDFGKLCHNIVYYRLGSSTAEKTPDDLIRRGQEIATRGDEPQLELEFAHIKRPQLIGGSLATESLGKTAKITNRYAAELSADDISRLAPQTSQPGYSENLDYFKQFTRFAASAFMLAPLGLRLLNTGGATATGVNVRLSIKAGSKIMVRSEDSYPLRPLYKYQMPLASGPRASHTRPSLKDVQVKQEGSEIEIQWNIPKVIPHLPIFSDGVFFVWSLYTPLEFQAAIYAENVKQPVQSKMTVIVETMPKNLTVEEIQALSEKFLRSDLANGTGLPRIYAKR